MPVLALLTITGNVGLFICVGVLQANGVMTIQLADDVSMVVGVEKASAHEPPLLTTARYCWLLAAFVKL